MKQFFTLAICFLFGLQVMAQTTYTGVVIDSENSDPLVGASVVVVGTSTGTITDLQGNFSLTVPGDESFELSISYTGYATQEVSVKAGNSDLGTIELAAEAIGLSEVSVIASVAVDRKTPVAVTTLKGDKIEALVGNQEFPEIMRKTPSVYVTKEGGGFGDARINVRGFDQRNVAVMINGIPVNDMENGWVYWSNWAGLADVTSRLQIQRGLGASKLAVASVGGSINIVTNAAEMERGGSAGLSIGNDGYQKYNLAYSTGLNDKGWAFSMLGSHTQGDGYAQGTKFRAWNFFVSTTKKINDNHMISFTALGAPQWHHQRFEPGTFDGVTLRTFVDPDDPNNEDPTTGRGIKFNWLHGTLNGEEFSWRRNFYHKPKAFLNHYWTVSPKTDIKTSFYYSRGNGGGTGPRGRINADDGSRFYDTDFRLRDANGHVRFDDIVRYNQGQLDVSAFASGETGTKTADATNGFFANSSDMGFIRRGSMNNHTWTGVLSTLTTELNDNLNLVAGIDGRYYKGEHFRRVENLLGNDAYLSRANDNNPTNYITTADAAEFGNFYNPSYKNDEENVLNYWNDGLVSWLGLFAQLEYSKDALSAFVSLSGSNQGFKRIDYFNYLDSDPEQSTDWQNFLGGTAKVGFNYNLDDNNNFFVNGGFFSRQPIFDNVFINFVNDINPDVKNQTVAALEAGYGYTSYGFSAKANVYYTEWGNRQFDQSLRNEAGDNILYIFDNVGQVHSGFELELEAYPTKGLTLTGMLSAGNWEYKNNFVAKGTNTDTNTPEGELTIYGDGLKVGDAAQFTASVGASYRVAKGLNLYADYFYADNLYANYNIQDATFQTPGAAAAKLPSYGLVDAGLSYNFKFQGVDVSWRLNINNVLDTEYVSEMNTSILDDPSTARNEFYDNLGIFGFGRTWNTGLKVRF